MGQPEDSPGVQLVDPLAADADCVANSGEGLGWVVGQAIVGDDDFSQTGGQLLDGVPERAVDLCPMDQIDRIDVSGRHRLQAGRARRTMVGSDGAPDGAGDGGDRIGTEGDTPLGIIAAKGRP